ncbi:MAG: ribosome assembly factor SBDS [Candidatus Pacearchaeota archaeon]
MEHPKRLEANIARIKKLGKDFEIILDDVEEALRLREKLRQSRKQGKKVEETEIIDSIQKICPVNTIFLDEKKGLKPTEAQLNEAFGTTDFFTIAAEIIESGDIVLPLELRKKLREQKFRQIVDFIARNAIDPRTKTLHPPERVEAALKQIGAKIDEMKSIDEQIQQIVNDLSKVLPIKLETRKLEVIVPAAFTAKAYGLITKYNRQQEEWLDDGSLKVIIALPSALQPEFFDKLNKATNGTALTKDLGEA